MASFRINNGGNAVRVLSPLPYGNNYIGSVDISGGVSIGTYNAVEYQNTNTTIGKVMLADSGNLDAFGRLRVSEPLTLYEGSLIEDSQPAIFDISQYNGAIATYNVNESTMKFDVSRAGQFVKRQSHYFAHYQPGKSLLIEASFWFGTNIPSGAYKRVGFFDDGEGIYFEQTSSYLSWNMRSQSQGTTLTVSQDNWNVDTLKGTGPSGYTLDISSTNLMVIDAEWLGVGRVRVGFIMNGRVIYCHNFLIPGLSVPYIKSPYLPARYEIGTSTNQAATVSMKQICCTIMSEGGFTPLGSLRSYVIDVPVSISNTSYTPVLSLRLNPAFAKGLLIPDSYSVISTNNNIVYVKMYTRTTLTGANFQNVTSYSQIDTSATSFSGGYFSDSEILSNISRITFQQLPPSVIGLQSDINGVPDILTIACKGSASSQNVAVSIMWREVL